MNYRFTKYEEFFRRVVNQLIFLVLLGALLYFITYKLSSSHMYSVGAVFFFILCRRLFIGGHRKKRIRQIDKVFGNKCSLLDKMPLVDGEAGWIKGIGFIENLNQPMWVKFSNKGVELFFLSRARKPPLLVPWEKVWSIDIEIQESNGELAGILGVKALKKQRNAMC